LVVCGFDNVAELVSEPEPAPAGAGELGHKVAGEGVCESASAVLEVADECALVFVDPDVTRGGAMDEGVGGEFGGGHGKLVDSWAGKA